MDFIIRFRFGTDGLEMNKSYLYILSFFFRYQFFESIKCTDFYCWCHEYLFFCFHIILKMVIFDLLWDQNISFGRFRPAVPNLGGTPPLGGVKTLLERRKQSSYRKFVFIKLFLFTNIYILY